jgi:hypothetical protein
MFPTCTRFLIFAPQSIADSGCSSSVFLAREAERAQDFLFLLLFPVLSSGCPCASFSMQERTLSPVYSCRRSSYLRHCFACALCSPSRFADGFLVLVNCCHWVSLPSHVHSLFSVSARLLRLDDLLMSQLPCHSAQVPAAARFSAFLPRLALICVASWLCTSSA